MTKAQQVYERINELVAAGAKKADAFRQLAEELGQPVKSLQGAYYQHSRKTGNGSPSRRRPETTPQSAVEQAIALLERALVAVDGDIELAKQRLDEAKAEHDALRAGAAERKQAIQAKIDALKS